MSPKRAQQTEAPYESASSTLAVAQPQSTLTVALSLSKFHDVILDKVTAKLDIPGLAHKVSDVVATKLAGQVRVEMLIERIMQQEEQALANSLVERVLEHMALSI